jgi:hypothetical protein
VAVVNIKSLAHPEIITLLASESLIVPLPSEIMNKKE